MQVPLKCSGSNVLIAFTIRTWIILNFPENASCSYFISNRTPLYTQVLEGCRNHLISSITTSYFTSSFLHHSTFFFFLIVLFLYFYIPSLIINSFGISLCKINLDTGCLIFSSSSFTLKMNAFYSLLSNQFFVCFCFLCSVFIFFPFLFISDIIKP